MTTTVSIASAIVTSVTTIALAEATDVAGPWWFVAIILPLAVFAGFLVRWIMQRQDTLNIENRDREVKREAREEKRSEAFQTEVTALQACVEQLRQLNDRQEQILDGIEATPGEVADELRKQGFFTKVPA